MCRELYQYLAGVQLPDKVDSDEDALALASTILETITSEPTEQLSDYELAMLVANSAETHLPIQSRLDRDRGYKKPGKHLEGARNKLPKDIAVDATTAIDYYLTYSEAYWAVDAILLHIVEMLDGMGTMIGTAFNIYKDRFQQQMNLNMARVCEVTNDYAL